MKTSPKGKAAGNDGITNEAILACSETGIQWLTTIFQKAWEKRKVPGDWQNAIVVPIWKKKGSKKDCNTYRSISLLSHEGKLYAKILEQRTRVKTEHLLSDAQFGFRKGRRCTDSIFARRKLCERTMEHDHNLRLPSIESIEISNGRSLSSMILRGSWQTTSRPYTPTVGEQSVWQAEHLAGFPVASGVRQGCDLSPLLFVIYMDQITKEANPDPEACSPMTKQW